MKEGEGEGGGRRFEKERGWLDILGRWTLCICKCHPVMERAEDGWQWRDNQRGNVCVCVSVCVCVCVCVSVCVCECV